MMLDFFTLADESRRGFCVLGHEDAIKEERDITVDFECATPAACVTSSPRSFASPLRKHLDKLEPRLGVVRLREEALSPTSSTSEAALFCQPRENLIYKWPMFLDSFGAD